MFKKQSKKKAANRKAASKAAKDTRPRDLVTDLHSPAALENFRDIFRFHGERPRGSDFHPTSTLFEGRFGRMFRTLPAAEFTEEDLKALAAEMIAKHEDPPTPETEDDDEENQGISAGYTYLGQFIDHDLTFDPASSLQKQNDPEALEDFRTPRFDLDCLYGRGPNDQPYLYEDKGVRMLRGRRLRGNPNDRRSHDLPRNSPPPRGRARALIGDPRNDENVIVSQLQSTMQRFHNRVVDFLTRKTGAAPEFEEVQRSVRWHYQWVVLHDFLPTIAGQDVVHKVLPHLKNKTSIRDDEPQLRFFHWAKIPFMPIEFSAAVYRFGHSMVRPIYRLNTTVDRKEIFSIADENNSLTGFRALPSNFAIDWSLFFNMGDAPPQGPKRLQKSYKIDTSLVNPLGSLPEVIGANVPSLAERNLIRGWRMGLPSGQTVARYMDAEVIPDEKLLVGKAIVLKPSDKPNKPILEISTKFAGNAPLWFYILAEAQQGFDGNNATPIRLGPVGGRIVAEVLIGLLLGDQYSFLSQDPSWKPFEEFTTTRDEFGMAELIKQAMKA
jgi:hypothetical protein